MTYYPGVSGAMTYYRINGVTWSDDFHMAFSIHWSGHDCGQSGPALGGGYAYSICGFMGAM